MDGIRRSKKQRQQDRRTNPATSSGGRGEGGLPTAPGAQLDAALVRQTLGDAQVTSGPPQRQQNAPAAAFTDQRNNTSATTTHATQAQTASSINTIAPQPFDVFVVLDFEATCVQDIRIPDPEVIEFPMVLVDARTARPVAEFQRYVRPQKHPNLSKFCTELTGIAPEMVQDGASFPEVFQQALAFLQQAGLGDAAPLRSYGVVTCGDWDLKVMLPAQLELCGSQVPRACVPASFQRWCNLKACMRQLQLVPPPSSTKNNTGGRPKSAPFDMKEMLQVMRLPLVGRHHSGIDDCRNIAAVLCALLRRGHVIDLTHEPPAHATARWHAADATLPSLERLTSTLADGVITTTVVPPVPAPSASSVQASTLQPRTAVPPKAASDVPPRTPACKGVSKTGASAAAGAPAPSPASASPPHRRTLNVDMHRNAVEELLANGATPSSVSVRTFTAEEQKTISKFLSTLLRHNADKWRVPITANGYVLLEDALRQPQMAPKRLTARDVAVLVRDSDKQRFRLAFGAEDSRLYIAAAQGHSMEGVEADYRLITKASEVPVAVHGTYHRAWTSIQEYGYLSTMTRHHIHFAKGLLHDAQVISGMRKDVQVFIYLNVPALLADGIPLFESANGVILTPGVGKTRQLPLKYVSKVVDRRSGRQLYPVEFVKGTEH